MSSLSGNGDRQALVCPRGSAQPDQVRSSCLITQLSGVSRHIVAVRPDAGSNMNLLITSSVTVNLKRLMGCFFACDLSKSRS